MLLEKYRFQVAYCDSCLTAVIQNMMVDIKWKVNKRCHQNHFCMPVNITGFPDALKFYISPDTKVLSHFVL